MPTEPAQSPATTSSQAPISAEAPSLADKLLVDVANLSRLTSLSVRTLRRMDASRDIPGRVAVGRRVLFQTETIREWVRAGLPGSEQWAVIQKLRSKR